MEIEVNPSRVGNAAPGQPPARAGAPTSLQDSASLDRAGALKAALARIPLVRPEKVDAARAAVGSAQFPPDGMLDAIAALLARNIQ